LRKIAEDIEEKEQMKPMANNLIRVSLIAGFLLGSLAPCLADPAPVIHYAPGENLEHVDVALIDRAEHEIDMAAGQSLALAG
jgi:hypothetical protein